MCRQLARAFTLNKRCAIIMFFPFITQNRSYYPTPSFLPLTYYLRIVNDTESETKSRNMTNSLVPGTHAVASCSPEDVWVTCMNKLAGLPHSWTDCRIWVWRLESTANTTIIFKWWRQHIHSSRALSANHWEKKGDWSNGGLINSCTFTIGRNVGLHTTFLTTTDFRCIKCDPISIDERWNCLTLAKYHGKIPS